MLTRDEKNEKIAALKGHKVEKEYMKSRIDSVEYIRVNITVTICCITLDSGYSVRGESACVDPENFDKEIGEKIAYDMAFGKLWPLFGFALAEQLYTLKNTDDQV